MPNGVVDGRYLLPHELPRVEPPLEAMSVVGDVTPARIHVAIVGARRATQASLLLARRLAGVVVQAGGVVISGGANGADAAAHKGAIDAGGRTWSVLGCGAPNVTPSSKKARFFEIVARGGAVLRPFPQDTPACPQNFKSRNRVIVALSEIVIIVQAAECSGTLNAAGHARALGRELWVAPGVGDAFAGSWQLIDQGARVLRHESQLAERLRAPELDGDAAAVHKALDTPRHPDEIALLTGLSTSAVASALLTLALGDVVVEDSAGLFRRKNLL